MCFDRSKLAHTSADGFLGEIPCALATPRLVHTMHQSRDELAKKEWVDGQGGQVPGVTSQRPRTRQAPRRCKTVGHLQKGRKSLLMYVFGELFCSFGMSFISGRALHVQSLAKSECMGFLSDKFAHTAAPGACPLLWDCPICPKFA